MTTTTGAAKNQPAPLTEQEIRNETANGLAADLLERALRGNVASMHITLVQIADSGLIGEDHDLRSQLDRLCNVGEELTGRLHKHYPLCWSGGARHLLKKCETLAEEVDLYRQEQFWLRSDPITFSQSEALIIEIYSFYRDVDFLMRCIDQQQPDDRVEDRCRVPQRTRNPYETIGHA